MPIHKAEAIVLNKRDFRETSLIVNFYTREFGKLSGILKGIRKEPNKFASSLELFSLNDIVFYKHSATTLHLVSQCDLKNNFTPLRQNMFKVGMASIVLELIDAVMQPDDRNEDIFNLGLDTLCGLVSSNNPDKITIIFKIKMLSLSGFKPNLDSCVICANKILGESKFSLKLGGLLCLKCAPKDLNSRAIFRGTIATILYIEKNDFKANLNLGINPQIKRELDLVLNSFLNYHLDKELKSQKVLNKIENFVPAIR